MTSSLVVLLNAAIAALPTPPVGTIQEVVFFATDGPIRVRLDVKVDGVPVEQRWQAAVDGLFVFCDRNGDGGLDAAEQSLLAGRNNNGVVEVNGVIMSIGRLPQLRFRDSSVDRNAFAEVVRNAGLGPIQTMTSPTIKDQSAAPTKVLFATLDRNGDGVLSVAELSACRAQLASLDANEDECLTVDELLQRPPPEANPFGQRQPQSAGIAYATTPSVVLVALPGRPLSAGALFAARDKDKDGALSAAELGCVATSETFVRLDVDGDGRLDADEVGVWLRQPVDITVGTAFTENNSAIVGNSRPALAMEWRGAYSFGSSSTWWRFDADAGMVNNRRAQLKQGRTTYTQLADDKGIIERKTLESKPGLQSALPLFDLADRDNDKKATKAELDALFAVLESLMNCRAVITVIDHGHGLFEWLDGNADRRLTPRELAAAPELLRAAQYNTKKTLTRDGIPRGYTILVRPASLDEFSTPPIGTFDVFLTNQPRRPVPLPNAPAWFAPMDRNGDGDVSAREFTGPPALFTKIDTNGDGLISPEEARAFETQTPAVPKR